MFVFLVALVVYSLTMAPTVSFWDCGEFIATSYILGIPHPPGTPLFVLLGRVFCLLPFFSQIAVRVNLISALFSALSIGLCYLVIVRIASRWLDRETPWLGVACYVGGIAGSLLVAFSSTFWSNAVETEVYGLSMFLSLLLVYVGLLWAEMREDKLLILIAYLGLLSLGIHMTTFLVMPVIFLLVLLYDKSRLSDFRFWITGIVLSLVMYAPLEWFLGMLFAWLIFCFFMLLISKIPSRWVLVFVMTLVGMVAYSVQLYIPIRSALEPAIDENNPDNWNSFKGFLERKQYGQTSMMERMLYRRGSWAAQFGTYPHMGFWGFFREQYNLGLERFAHLKDSSSFKKLEYLLLGLPPFLFGIFGIYTSLKRKWKEGTILLLLFLSGTLGLILYMNFADGTRYDHWTGELIRLEVRDRDYFFTPGFIFFGILAGTGISGLILYLSRLIRQINKNYLGYLLGALCPILLAWSSCGLFHHHSTHTRAGNWLPYDYAYNLLNSCDRDAILFTNGDNDTFPLWFLQQVEKIRTDVRVVNLSLLNTDWYILQLKKIWNVPISLEDDQIVNTVPLRGQGGVVVERPAREYYDKVRKTNRYLFPVYNKKAGRLLMVQDLMVEDIVIANQWRYPVIFSLTVPAENRAGLDSHLKEKGLVLQVVKEQGERMIDPQISYRYLFEVYQFRGLDQMSIYKDESAAGLLMNYPERFIDLSFYFSENNDQQKSEEILKRAIQIYPDYYRTYMVLSKQYRDQGDLEAEKQILEQCQRHLEKLTAKYPNIALYHQYLGLAYLVQGKIQKAEQSFTQRLSLATTDFIIASNLMLIYQKNGRQKEALGLLEEWVRLHPDDRAASDWLMQMKGGR